MYAYKKNEDVDNMNKDDLIKWINDTAIVKIGKMEDLSFGDKYCILVDNLFPGLIDVKQLKTAEKSDCIQNFNILQEALRKKAVVQDLPINDLVEKSFYHHYIFLKWFIRFYNINAKILSTKLEFENVTKLKEKTSVCITGVEDVEELRLRVESLHSKIDQLQNQNFFYRSKLRKIEGLCEQDKSSDKMFVWDILNIIR